MVNIFYLAADVRQNCRFHCDKHVNKMIIESTQLLSAICRLNGQTEVEAPYGLHSVKHPVALWVGASLSNWRWLHKFTLALHDEYQFRYDRTEDHKSAAVCKKLKEPEGLVDIGITERPQAMPVEYQVKGNPIQAYRNYYIGEKQYFAKWTRREVPEWYREGCEAWNRIHPDTPQNRQQQKEREAKIKVEKVEERKRKKKEREEAKAAKGGKGKKPNNRVTEMDTMAKEESKTQKESRPKRIVKRKRSSPLSSTSSSSLSPVSKPDKKKKKD